MAVASLGSSISAQARIVFACTTRVLQSKNRESPIGVLSSFVEPLATILVMTLVFSYVRFRVPTLGEYLMVFLMTGILPITMFRQGAMGSEQGFNRLKKQLAMPQIHTLDLLIAGALTSFITMVTLFLGITVFFHLIYDNAWPQNIVFCMIPAICNTLIGLGFGCLNLVVKSWWTYWGTIFSVVTGPIGILSGIFFTVDRFPPSIQAILYWNPLMHSTELMRTYYYPEYNSDFFDPIYYYGWTFGMLFVGLILERTFRYRLLKDKK